MPTFYTPTQVESLVRTQTSYATNFNVKQALDESVSTKHPKESQNFDIFLSYKNADLKLALGIHADLIRRGYAVYLDQIMDPELDRSNVNRSTAERLRNRLIKSKCVFYIATDNSDESKWMPWELGFEDGYRGKSAVVPVTNDRNFRGVEFVTIYSRVQPDADRLWMYHPDNTLDTNFDDWLKRTVVR